MRRSMPLLALTFVAGLAGVACTRPEPTAKAVPEKSENDKVFGSGSATGVGGGKVLANDGPGGDDGPFFGISGNRPATNDEPRFDRSANLALERAIAATVALPQDPASQRVVTRHGLSIMNVAWEDTGRSVGSSVGPNITDLTLQVRHRDENNNWRAEALPVVRFPNFTDKTGDIPADRFWVRVGNAAGGGGSLRSVPLTKVLGDIRSYSSDASSILGDGNLLASRDSHFLVSGQAVLLPVPPSGKVTFNPVVYNYQSYPGSPAVLTILVTRQGTSIKVIENRPEDSSGPGRHGQELYFNDHGSRSAFTAERKSDVEQRIAAQGGPRTEDEKSAIARGADVVFLVQVPLKHRAPVRAAAYEESDLGSIGGGGYAKGAPAAAPAPQAAGAERSRRSDVETAVVGHGPKLGPFVEGPGLRLERDPAFPIRVTAQFYKATSTGVLDANDAATMAETIGDVYAHADYVGSLVMPSGDANRPTAWTQMNPRWFAW
jgi:hypothetical protein